MAKAIILLSGGLDSTVILAEALSRRRICHALTFQYGQKHAIEIEAAQKIANYYKISQQVISIDPSLFQKSALTSPAMQAHVNRSVHEITHSIPNTYVPARNTLFLAYGTAIAEAHEASEIYFGANADDLHPYPDCRPAFIVAFQNVLDHATKQAVTANPPKLITPLLSLTKKDIFQKAVELGVPIELTWSCYQPVNNQPCKMCDSCILRANARVKENTL